MTAPTTKYEPVYTGPNRVRGTWDQTTTPKEKWMDVLEILPGPIIGIILAWWFAPWYLKMIHWLALHVKLPTF